VDELPYREIPPPPPDVNGAAVMARLLDGLGFRYRWATEGLRPEDADFRTSARSMTLRELLRHVCRLVEWTAMHLGGPPISEGLHEIDALRAATLAAHRPGPRARARAGRRARTSSAGDLRGEGRDRGGQLPAGGASAGLAAGVTTSQLALAESRKRLARAERVSAVTAR